MADIFISDPWLWLINGVVMGFMIGVVTLEWLERRAAVKRVESAEQDLKTAATKLQLLHNDVTTKIMEIEEKVSAHDYQLTARVKPHVPNPFGGKP